MAVFRCYWLCNAIFYSKFNVNLILTSSSTSNYELKDADQESNQVWQCKAIFYSKLNVNLSIASVSTKYMINCLFSS